MASGPGKSITNSIFSLVSLKPPHSIALSCPLDELYCLHISSICLLTMSFPSAQPARSLLDRHRLLSPRASVRVSPLCLGAMNFGAAHAYRMGECTKETAFAIMDLCKCSSPTKTVLGFQTFQLKYPAASVEG